MKETWEMQVRSLVREDPLEEGMATHCSILTWRIPCTEEPGGLQSIGPHRIGHDWSNLAHTHGVVNLKRDLILGLLVAGSVFTILGADIAIHVTEVSKCSLLTLCYTPGYAAQVCIGKKHQDFSGWWSLGSNGRFLSFWYTFPIPVIWLLQPGLSKSPVFPLASVLSIIVPPGLPAFRASFQCGNDLILTFLAHWGSYL